MEKRKMFNIIWKDYRKKIYFFISHILPAEKDIYDDLFQEIMMKIFVKSDSYSKKYSLDAWIYSIARNHCIDFLKTKKNESTFSEEHFPVSGESPEKILGEKEMHIKVHNCLAELDFNERQIVYLYFFEGMSFKNISNVLDMNINTVKTKMRFLKRKLHSGLKEVL